MTRTTIMLPEDLKDKSMRLARQLGVSFGELVRTALHQTVSPKTKPPHLKIEDSLFSDREVYHGPVPKDLSTHHDQYLYEE